VIEVLLAVIRPKQLLIGKTIGIGLVALGHASVLIVVAYVTTRIVGLDITGGLRAGDLLVGAVWFLLGYALYCSVFAAAGALCAPSRRRRCGPSCSAWRSRRPRSSSWRTWRRRSTSDRSCARPGESVGAWRSEPGRRSKRRHQGLGPFDRRPSMP
jgi:hypothetical protein